MKAISRWLDRFCYNHPNFGIPNLMKFIVIGNVLVYFLDMFSRGYVSWLFSFFSPLILQGQIWRIISFIFVPTSGYNPNDMFSILWFAMTTLFYYYIGNSLERQWGTARFTVFYGLGVVLNIVVGFVLYAVSASAYPAGLLGYLVTADMTYVNMSLFFAFATLYPDMRVLLFFIIPIKIKWLAWIDAALFAWSILSSLFGVFTAGLAALPGVVLPLVAILNYFIFFWDNFLQLFGRVKYRTSRQTINFKQATKKAQQQKGYIHKCAVCGKTDTDYPNEEFRYCSKCNGYYCYCSEHIHNHVHIE